MVYPANGDEPYIKKMEFSWQGAQNRPGLWPTGINLSKAYRGSLPSTHTKQIIITEKHTAPKPIKGEYSIYYNLDPRLPINLNAARAAGIDPKLPGTVPTWRGDMFIGMDAPWLEASLLIGQEQRPFPDVRYHEYVFPLVNSTLSSWYRSDEWKYSRFVDEVILRLHLDENLQNNPEAKQLRIKNGTDNLDPDRLRLMAKDAAAMQRLQKYEERQAERIEKQGRCLRCNKHGQPKLMVCSRCLSAKYCSRECQRANWQFHKMVCGSSGGEEEG